MPTLLSLVETNVQQALNTNCIDPFPPYFIDHCDVTGGNAAVTSQSTNFQIPVNVFIVDQSSLQANVNGTPPGALTPAAQATVLLSLTLQGTLLTLSCTGVQVPNPAFNAAAQQVQQTLGTVGSFEFKPMFDKLGLPAPTTSSMLQVGASLLIRFDPATPASDHLQSGENWCAFIDANTMVALAKSKVPTGKLEGHGITGVNVNGQWAPSGTTPHVNLQVTGAAQVPDPFSGNVELDMGIDFSLMSVLPSNPSQSPTDLVERVTWSLSIDLGEFVPGFIDDYVASLIAAQLDPSTFGGVADGPNQFEFDTNLPLLVFGGATLFSSSLVGLQDGMVLGGPVKGIGALSQPALTFDVSPFPGAFAFYWDCLAGPAQPPTLGTVTVQASADFSGAGKLCGVDIVSPTGGSLDVTPYLATAPGPGTVTDSGSISFTLSGPASMIIASNGQPIEVILRTTRGVRMIDFGVPPKPQFDSQGRVTNAYLQVVRNCPGQPVPWWQRFHRYNPNWSVDPPGDWTETLEQAQEFESTLVTVTGLQQGEVLTFDQPIDGGRSFFTAGADGQVVVPALMATRSFDEGALLSTMNRSSLGNVALDSVTFSRVALLSMPGAISHQLSGDGQRAIIVTTFRNRTETTEIDALGIPRTVQNRSEQGVAIHGEQLASARVEQAGAAAPGQAVAFAGSSQSAPDHSRHGCQHDEIPGIVRTLNVPGHAGSNLSVVELDDGTYRTLVRDKNGSSRVSGTVARWPAMPAVSGAWAISSTKGNRIAVFRVRRTSMPKPCHCKEAPSS